MGKSKDKLGQIVILNGAPRSGKTSIAHVIREAFDGLWVNIGVDALKERGCRRLWLITTNDNTLAQRFYENRGFAVKAVHKDAIAGSRKLKPELPEKGFAGIPIRDEIELELQIR
jgi:chloramphenicol 3-O-phosphotransferase